MAALPVFPGLWRALATSVLSAALAGCATTPPPTPQVLLHDALFNHPPAPPEATQVMALSPAMHDHVQALRQRVRRSADLPLAFAESLYRPPGRSPGLGAGLQLDYDASTTRNAAQAFEARAGNCLSLVVMTAAMARALGLEVGFQSVHSDDVFRSEADLTLRTGHVNLTLGERGPRIPGQQATTAVARQRLVIDFLPQASAAALPAQAIDEARVLAMFMNNRAVESLLARAPATAYAWARESLRADPGFWAAYNTLGVVYQRAGHLDAAAAAFEQVLRHDPQLVAAMANLAAVRQAQGRSDEAALWTSRRLALEPYPPLHFLRLGQVALASGNYGLARQHFRRELRLQDQSHEAWLGLAQVHAALGELAEAEQALQQALAASSSGAERARYAAKLGTLRSAVMH